MTHGGSTRTRPRDRIVDAARDMFHKQGFRGVGVDAIAEAAGTNKMTLYRHFGSKDDLIVECLQSVVAEARSWWTGIEKNNPNDRLAQLEEWIELAGELILTDCRGCDLSNAAVELADDSHPAHRVIAEFKAEHRDWLATVCAGAGIERSELLADILITLIEGARVMRQAGRRKHPQVDFTSMATAVVQSFRGRAAAEPRVATKSNSRRGAELGQPLGSTPA